VANLERGKSLGTCDHFQLGRKKKFMDWWLWCRASSLYNSTICWLSVAKTGIGDSSTNQVFGYRNQKDWTGALCKTIGIEKIQDSNSVWARQGKAIGDLALPGGEICDTPLVYCFERLEILLKGCVILA
jgi:hypothetical protein